MPSMHEPVAGPVIEALAKLETSLAASSREMSDLTKRIKSLNGWLLVVTVAIGVLAVVHLLVALKVVCQ